MEIIMYFIPCMASYGHKYCRQMLARRPLAGAFSPYPPPCKH